MACSLKQFSFGNGQGFVGGRTVAVSCDVNTYKEFFNAEQIMTEWTPPHVSVQQLKSAEWHTVPL